MLRATLPRSPLFPGLLFGLGLCLWPGTGTANREPAPQGISPGPGPGPGPALASGAQPETHIKIVPRPVLCVPCPCECPEVKGPASSQGTSVSPEAPVVATAPATGPGDEPKGTEPERPGPLIQRTPVVPPRPVAPPPPPRGIISGSVVVHDRGGKERADNSDVVIYIEKVARKYAAFKRERRMAQRDKTFAPHVLAVPKGSTVEFPNEDKFFHNVFSLSEGNVFDLGLYRAGTTKTMTFDKTGVVDVYCNIHPNMWGQILVLDNPFFAVSNKEGTYEIPKVPPGNYTLVAWLSGGESVRQQVHVVPGGRAQIKFDVKEGASTKPHLNKFNQPYGRYK